MKLKSIVMVLVALLFGYTGFWFFIGWNTEVYLEGLEQNLEQQDVQFSYDDYEVSGFPYRIVVEFINPRIKFNNRPLWGEIEARKIEAITQPWKLGHFILFPEDSKIWINYGTENVKEFFIRPEAFSLSFSEQGRGAFRMSVELREVYIQTTLQMDLPKIYESITLHFRRNVAMTITKDGPFEPKLLELALSMNVRPGQSFAIKVSFLGTEVPTLTQESLIAWRNQGGTVEFEKAAYLNETRSVKANGSFTIDDKLRPLGAMGIEADSANDIVTLLQAGGFVSADEAYRLKNEIDVLPLRTDSPVPVSLSLTIQDGVAALGPLYLFDLGPVIRE